MDQVQHVPKSILRLWWHNGKPGKPDVSSWWLQAIGKIGKRQNGSFPQKGVKTEN